MKECKVLSFDNPKREFYKPQYVAMAKEVGNPVHFPDMEKYLDKYLAEGFVVKTMTQNGGTYTFYLERDV